MYNVPTNIRDKTAVSEPKKATDAAPELDGSAAFEALVCEFHWTALQVAGVTQLFNAAVQNGQSWMLRSCRNMLPAEAAAVGLAIKAWKDIAIPQSLAKNLARIFFNLADAKRRTELLLEKLGALNAKIPAASLEQLTMMWRKLSEDCLAVVHELEPETRWRLNGLYIENALILGRFVKEAARGGASGVDSMGHIGLPLLPQRRREPRFALLQPCRVFVRGQSLPAIARDVSRSGMGISCQLELRLREAVVIELKGGRRFKGRIVWCKEGKQGLQFDEPLPFTDPLLTS